VTISTTELLGKHALVTGASRGIGAAIAAALVDRGARVTIVSRTRKALEDQGREISNKTGGEVFCAPADVTKRAEITKAFDAARAAHGPINILVNNAGHARSAPFARTDETLWSDMISTNLDSVYLCSQVALPDMLQKNSGRIINVASSAGLKGYRYVAAYCAAKHGVIGLTRALALELVNKGITVNAICPGFTDTPMLQDSLANIVEKTGCTPQQARERLTSSNPSGRLIEVDEVAAAVLWLCGPGARSVTGQAIAVDGGEVMH